MTKPNAEMIDPKEAGARRLNLKSPIFDAETLSRVDSALEEMSGSFREWLDEEIDKLHAAQTAAFEAQWSFDSLNRLWGVAHDLKGVAGMYGYPLITQFAASLCRLLDTDKGKAAAQASPNLIKAHCDAIRVAARDEIKTESEPLGGQVLRMLEESVAALDLDERDPES